ncbi:MAG: Rnf-Nqr domain containing protein, partial [Oscillospiraceae bacterium]
TFRVIFNAIIASLIFIPSVVLLEKWMPGSTFQLGIYLPLLATNSLIIQKSESRFHKMDFKTMLLQLVCNAAGFFLVATIVGAFRELFGKGMLLGKTIPGFTFTAPALMLPFCGFILIGFLAAGMKKLVFYLNSKPPQKARQKKHSADINTVEQ